MTHHSDSTTTLGLILEVRYAYRPDDARLRMESWFARAGVPISGWHERNLGGPEFVARDAEGLPYRWSLLEVEGAVLLAPELWVGDPDYEPLIDVALELPRVAAVARAALADPEVADASLRRDELRGSAPWYEPLGRASHIATLSESDEAALGVELPPPGWTLHGRRANGAILIRLLDVLDDDIFLREDADHMWALARIAAPGAMMWELLPEGPERIGQTIRPVQFRAAEGVGVYSAVVLPDGHLDRAECLALLRLARRGLWSTGEAMARVVVVFVDRETAVQERRPLLDNGVEPAFWNEGELELVCSEERRGRPGEAR